MRFAVPNLVPDPCIAQVPPQVLFLCTGNYYRSRFAEELFNHLALEAGFSVRAYSLGFTPHPKTNPGPISKHALLALAKYGIVPERPHMPASVSAEDFAQFKVCIVLCEREHRPMMEQMFPEFVDRVIYWRVEDLGLERPENALAQIESAVRLLLAELANSK
ncbi:MAG TPA: low molecular weight phosphatase family protein [Candidatus Paceibacterota bacterium]|nr:low molecular weight phosphatase family protein [Candidatus Paceibacterota bacterium]